MHASTVVYNGAVLRKADVVYAGAVVSAGTAAHTGVVLHAAAAVHVGGVVYARAVVHANNVVYTCAVAQIATYTLLLPVLGHSFPNAAGAKRDVIPPPIGHDCNTKKYKFSILKVDEIPGWF
eukprot:4731994-Pyramimonas_sp.AAC.1